MLNKIKCFIDKNKLIESGDTILVACSGGPDSLALLHILLSLRSDYTVSLVVAHVDHMFRGSESALEAQFVRDFCREHDLICHSKEIDVPRFIAETGLSAQTAARELRYSYLRQIAQEIGGAKIATGHHADDQGETVLLNLLRGAGSTGLRGMLPYHDGIIRPLLGVNRPEIMNYCIKYRLSPQQDSSNLNIDYLRNSIRLELIPLLQERYNPAISAALCRTAELIGDEHEFIRSTAEQLWQVVVRQQSTGIIIDGASAKGVHIAVLREIFRMAIEKKHLNLTGISFCHVENMIDMLWNGRVGTTLDLPGNMMARKGYEVLEIVDCCQPAAENAEVVQQQISVPGITYVDELGIEICAEFLVTLPEAAGRWTVFLDWEEVQLPLEVRTRRSGDRFQPSGMSGSKKIKDFFIDIKLPRVERDRVPIICDQRGVLWIAGFRQSDIGLIKSSTKRILQLKIGHYEKRDGEKTYD